MVKLHVLREFTHGRGCLVPGDDHTCLVVLELVAQFARGVQRVVLDNHRAQAQGRVERHNVLRAVRQDQGHPVPGLHAELAQALGGTCHLLTEFTVAGAASKELHGGAVPSLGHRALKHGTE